MTDRQYADKPPTDGTGEATLDLSHRLSTPAEADHPAVAEARIRSRSRYLIAGGTLLTLAITTIAVVYHLGHGTFLPVVYVMPAYALSCGAVLIGCMEYITRHSRAQQALALQIVLQVQADQLRLVDLMDEDKQQAYFRGAAETMRDMSSMLSTGTGGPAVGRAASVPQNRSGGEVVALRRKTSDSNAPLF